MNTRKMLANEICEYFGISRQTLENWASKGMPRHEIKPMDRIKRGLFAKTRWEYDAEEITKWRNSLKS